MPAGGQPIFVDEAPPIEIKRGHVYVTGGETWAWTPAAFRAFLEVGKRVLDQWDREQRGAVPLRKKRGH